MSILAYAIKLPYLAPWPETQRPGTTRPALPLTVGDLAHSVAWHLGRLDASNGVCCCPEMVYADRAKQIAYCEGYRSIAGDNFTTRQFLADEVRPLPHSVNW